MVRPRNRAQKLGISLALHSLLTLGAASAQPSTQSAPNVSDAPLTVSFKGPGGCDPNALEAQTRKLLKSVAERANVHVAAKATRLAPQRYGLELLLSGAVTGKRSLTAHRCDEALKAGAVVVALAINPNALSSVTNTDTSTEAENPSPAQPNSQSTALQPAASQANSATPGTASPSSSTTGSGSADSSKVTTPDAAKPIDTNEPELLRKPAQPGAEEDIPIKLGSAAAPRVGLETEPEQTVTGSSRTVYFVATLAGRLGSGFTPKLAPGALLELGVKLGVFRLTLGGYWDPLVQLNREDVNNIRLSELGGGLGLCATLLERPPFSGALCARGHATRLTVKANTLLDATARSALIFSAELGPALELELLSFLALRFAGGVRLPTTSPRFVIDVADDEHRQLFRVKLGAFGLLGFDVKL